MARKGARNQPFHGARDWRRLALAAMAAGALAVAWVPLADAQAARKAKQKAPPQQAEQSDAADKTPAKKKRQTTAEAQQAIEAASKLLESGKVEPAVQSLTATLSAGRLPPAVMAKALLYRGIAYRQQKKPAQAIADLTSALWLKGGLGDAERKDALAQRAAAYQEAGLTETGETVAAVVPRETQSPRPTRTAAAWSTDTTPAPAASLAPQDAPPAAASTSPQVWNPFAGLFGGPSAPPASAPPRQTPVPPAPAAAVPAAPAPAAAAPAATPRVASAWSRNTQVSSAPAPTETASLPARPEGKYRVQVGMVRTQEQAQALVGKVKAQYAAAFGAREPEVDQAVVGNMGSFYRVRVGPFASPKEGQAACSKLKGSGLDCLVVTQ